MKGSAVHLVSKDVRMTTGREHLYNLTEKHVGIPHHNMTILCKYYHVIIISPDDSSNVCEMSALIERFMTFC